MPAAPPAVPRRDVGAPSVLASPRVRDRADRRRPGVLVAVVLAAVALLGAGCTATTASTAPSTTRAPGTKPNILVVMTDDQTLESLRVMNTTKAELVDEGTSFSRYYVSFPNCCPSRATYLTGQYSHNNGVEDNLPPLGGAAKLKSDQTLPVWLQSAGYTTSHVGKYLNTWGEDGNITPPPGWNEWFGLIDPSTYQYYGYSVSDNGTKRDFGDGPQDYQTDVLGQKVVDFVKAQSGTNRPWFLSFTPLAPHAETTESIAQGTAGTTGATGEFKWSFPKPAPRHERSLAAQAPRTSSFNDADVSGKPTELAERPLLGEGNIKLIDQGYQLELQTLLAVDEWVGKIVQALKDTNQIDDTVILFTSDNGFFHGEHRLAFQKFELYEPSVHVPLIIRGGPFAKKKQVATLAGNVDLAPTILALAGAKAGLPLDGIDLATVAATDKAPTSNRALLLENRSKKGIAQAILTPRYKYIERRGEQELYDLDKDPDERTNLATDPGAASLKAELAKRLDKLKTCADDTCRTS